MRDRTYTDSSGHSSTFRRAPRFKRKYTRDCSRCDGWTKSGGARYPVPEVHGNIMLCPFCWKVWKAIREKTDVSELPNAWADFYFSYKKSKADFLKSK